MDFSGLTADHQLWYRILPIAVIAFVVVYANFRPGRLRNASLILGLAAAAVLSVWLLGNPSRVDLLYDRIAPLVIAAIIATFIIVKLRAWLPF